MIKKYDVVTNTFLYNVVINNEANSLSIKGVGIDGDNISDLELNYIYNKDEEDQISFKSNDNKLIINKDESKCVYSGYEFELTSESFRKFMTLVMFYRKYEELREIADQIGNQKNSEVLEEFKKLLTASTRNTSVHEYVAMNSNYYYKKNRKEA